MPQVNEATARESYTIAGETFNVFQPYIEGAVLTAGEASALNQTYAENIRNNFASAVKEAKAAGTFDLEVFQGNLDDYMEDYEFGVRRGGGGRTGDPVMQEALGIARDKVRAALKKAGHDLKQVKSAEVTTLARQVIEKYPAIMEAARARVAAQQEIADIVLDGTPAEGTDTEAPARKSRGESQAAAE